jgi:5-(carboxyamino)imidazole ribonucleotide mutase
VQTKTLSGVDSLHSIVQMPPGVPVATVAINGAKNAGILAAQILAHADAELFSRIAAFRDTQEQEVMAKAQRLEAEGYTQYLTHLS